MNKKNPMDAERKKLGKLKKKNKDIRMKEAVKLKKEKEKSLQGKYRKKTEVRILREKKDKEERVGSKWNYGRKFGEREKGN